MGGTFDSWLHNEICVIEEKNVWQRVCARVSALRSVCVCVNE